MWMPGADPATCSARACLPSRSVLLRGNISMHLLASGHLLGVRFHCAAAAQHHVKADLRRRQDGTRVHHRDASS